ncbi:MAG: hypothetical protein IPG01_16070 [Chitinophagaceae bacterium]|nr:hypothetical protein [Chitinophagaceae bacterium]
MQESEILNLWKTYNKKLEENLILNKKNAEEITRIKVKSFLSSMKPLKLFTILVGIMWVVFVDVIIFSQLQDANLFFLLSAGIQVVLTKAAIVIYIYQLILIHQVDISEPVVVTQLRLARLKSTTLWVARLLFLQLPVWTTFYWNQGMLENGNLTLYIIQAITTLAFTYAAVWLFLNIRHENKDQKWFRLIFDGNEWSPVIKSIELMNQLNEFTEDSKSGNEFTGR